MTALNSRSENGRESDTKSHRGNDILASLFFS